MQIKNNSSERGQAIVLIVLAMIVLLGFTALAVDGSMVYSDRRWAQNVADASALAGAAAAAQYMENEDFIYTVGIAWGGVNNSCPSVVTTAVQEGYDAAVARAQANNYELPQSWVDEQTPGLKIECVMEYPEPFLDVTVVVQETTETAFAQVVFPDGLENTVIAVARVRPAISMGYGRSIVALNPDDCSGNSDGMIFLGLGGGNYLDVDHGGVWSNGCLRVNNQTGNVTIHDGGSADYFYPKIVSGEPTVNVINFPDGGGPRDLDENVDARMPPEEYALRYTPNCSEGSGNRYTTNEILDLAAQGPLESGRIYCITRGTGQGRTVLRIDSSFDEDSPFEGHNVTIVLLEVRLEVTAGANVDLNALPYDATYNNAAHPGLLLYAPSTNTECSGNQYCMDFDGNAFATLSGTMLAPGVDATIRFIGNEISRVDGQIIGWNVQVGGSSGALVNYIPNNTVVYPTYVSLKE